jgi:SAM-dependent methyltransferase
MTARAGWSARFATASAEATQRAYEGIMVPRLFAPWGELLADQVALAPGERVLDVACGPGTVARIAAQRVGPCGRVVGVDFSPAMIAVAAAKPAVPDGAPITYLAGPADAVAVPDQDVDVVTCQQGLQFFPDRVAALAEMHRVLRAGGRLGLAVWCDIAECPPFTALAAGIADVLGKQLAATYRGGPWGLTDPSELAKLAEAAGFDRARITRVELPLVFDGGAAQLVDTLALTGVAAEVAGLDHAGHQRFVDAVARAAAPISDGGGVRSSAAANVLLALR